jgi:hypothetical protein
MDTSLLQPLAALILWTLVVLAWLYAVRLPAIGGLGVPPAKLTRADLERLPPRERNVSANYIHLLEQPVLFYAAVLASHLAGLTDELQAGLAWAYVGLRILHSLIQGTGRSGTIRFFVFIAASLLLIVMAVRLALAVF